LALVLALVLVLRHCDDWSAGTLLGYGPRWPVALPFAALIPAALIWPMRVLLPTLAAALIFAFFVLGLVVNGPGAGVPPPEFRLTVLTLNADGERLATAELEGLLAREKPDLVMLQETPDRLVEQNAWRPGWRLRAFPPRLLIASRYPMEIADSLQLSGFGGTGGAMRCRVETPAGPLLAANVHLDTPRGGIEPVLHGADLQQIRSNIALREVGSAAAAAWLADAADPCVIAGDFNLTGESRIYQRFWSSYRDAFSEGGLGLGYTKHTRWHGVRIDHVLHGTGLRCVACRVAGDVGSDHRPLVAVLQMQSVRAGTP
jgi:endonuclease/exonuclease/phosphatase (EEP) superfamily protein YafD